MAKPGHVFHHAICRSDAPELGVVVVACRGHGEALCKSELSCRGWKCNHPTQRSMEGSRELEEFTWQAKRTLQVHL